MHFLSNFKIQTFFVNKKKLYYFLSARAVLIFFFPDRNALIYNISILVMENKLTTFQQTLYFATTIKFNVL